MTQSPGPVLNASGAPAPACVVASSSYRELRTGRETGRAAAEHGTGEVVSLLDRDPKRGRQIRNAPVLLDAAADELTETRWACRPANSGIC